MNRDFDYKEWCNINNIDSVVNMLYNRPADLYKQLPDTSCVYVEDWNSHVADITSVNVKDMFPNEQLFFSKIDNLERVLYMCTDPNKIISEHVDDDDTECYRILVGVHSSGDTWFENISKKETKYLTKGVSLGIDVEIEPHRGRNNTNDLWTMLIICLYKDNL